MIKVKNLIKTYDGGTEALNDVSFSLFQSEITGYIGVNGAGKSTTIKILSGLLPFDKGVVSIGSYNLPEDSIKVKSIIGYVPESPDLFNSLSVNEFFDFIKNIREIDNTIFAKRVNYFAELFKFKEHMKNSIGKLSKGNKQKIMIVSAILHNPEIILLDEPLNGLDAFSISTFLDMISKLSKRGKVIFYCSHLLDIMEKVSDRIIIIEKGKIKINELKKDLELNQDYKSLDNIFRNISENNSNKEFFYDEVFN